MGIRINPDRVIIPLTDKLQAVFAELPAEAQAAFGTIAASVLMFIQFGNTAAAKLVIENASVPPELQSIKDQLLACFDG